MAEIKFTTQIANKICDNHGITSGTATTGQPAMAYTAGGTTGYLRIMSGTVPSQNDIDMYGYPEWDRLIGSPSEVLIERAHTTAQFSNFITGTDAYVEWTLQTAIAANSGVASWWLWTGYQSYNPADRGNNPGGSAFWLGMLMGDITLVGGSGSMTLADLNIVAGQTYELGPAQFKMPRSFSY